MDQKKRLRSFGVLILYNPWTGKQNELIELNDKAWEKVNDKDCFTFSVYGSCDENWSQQESHGRSLFTIVIDNKNDKSSLRDPEEVLNNLDTIVGLMSKYRFFENDIGTKVVKEFVSLVIPVFGSAVKRWLKAGIDDIKDDEVSDLYGLAVVLRNILELHQERNTGGLVATKKAINAIEMFFRGISEEVKKMLEAEPVGLVMRVRGEEKQNSKPPRKLQLGDQMYWNQMSRKIGFRRGDDRLCLDSDDDDNITIPVSIQEEEEFYRLARMIASTHRLKVNIIPQNLPWYFVVEFVAS
ncbi:MAG: hypothetical protein WC310_02565 [Patescibacteria group bacterium]|jgi:hypothetical protein